MAGTQPKHRARTETIPVAIRAPPEPLDQFRREVPVTAAAGELAEHVQAVLVALLRGTSEAPLELREVLVEPGADAVGPEVAVVQQEHLASGLAPHRVHAGAPDEHLLAEVVLLAAQHVGEEAVLAEQDPRPQADPVVPSSGLDADELRHPRHKAHLHLRDAVGAASEDTGLLEVVRHVLVEPPRGGGQHLELGDPGIGRRVSRQPDPTDELRSPEVNLQPLLRVADVRDPGAALLVQGGHAVRAQDAAVVVLALPARVQDP
mmetsp:Transcript_84318/g.238974  ORF Transcript_84318/g.238974 Transcript_84318/m.238974 type:complete len:262 (-) Transcript_84318:1382-2167(-)